MLLADMTADDYVHLFGLILGIAGIVERILVKFHHDYAAELIETAVGSAKESRKTVADELLPLVKGTKYENNPAVKAITG